MTGAAERSVVGLDDLPSTPWRNGGGVTRSVAADSAAADPAWRISIATVTDGAPFSVFAGYDRTFIPITPGITLHTGADELTADADGAVCFDGAAPVHAKVACEPGLAVNVMTRASHRARIRRRIVTGQIGGADARIRAIVVTGGAVTDAAGRTVAAPAVVTPGYRVLADDAKLLDIFIDIQSPTDRTPA
jgi:environmental stress-induced protein Ves